MDTHPPLALEARGLRKEYPGLVALDDVSLTVGAGELHALVGENGAGKSTLVKIVAGQVTPDGGELHLSGRRVAHFSPLAARGQGVTMVPQHPDLFRSLTALENLFVGDWPRGPAGTVAWREMRRRAEGVLAQMEVDLDLGAPVSALSVAERQLLQIARALLADARLLILDEPTAPLGHQETARLFELIRRLHGRGVSMIYISHRLAEVFELAQAVTVLRDGKWVSTLPISQVTREGLIGMMVGEAAEGRAALHAPGAPGGAVPQAGGALRPPLLAARGLSRAGAFQEAGVEVRAGEIVGLAGVAGSGRNELLRALAGVEPAEAGSLKVGERELRGAGPRALLEAGVSLVPADRHQEALILPMSCVENITLGCLRRFASRLGFIRRGAEQARASELARQLDVRAAGLDRPVGSLSGGNQQKVALASRLAPQPRVLLLEEPTQGVDVGARAEIHRLMRELASGGVGLVLVSSDLPELLSLSDRVVVMHRGRLVGELSGERATQEAVLDLALGARAGGLTPGPSPAGRGEKGASPAAVRPLSGTERGTGGEGTAVRRARRRARAPVRELTLAVVLVLLTGAVCVAAPSFASLQNLTDILINNSYLLIAGVGMTLVIVTAGIDISAGSVLAGCATAAGATAAAGWPIPGILAAALLTGLALGAVNAALITGARIPPIIATLATLTLFRHILIHLTGGRWIDLPPGFREFGLSRPLGVPLSVWVAGGTGVAGALFARWTPLGRSIYAVGSNAEAAGHVGISVRRVQWAVYTLLGLLTGLSAFVYAGHWSAIQTNAGVGFEMVVITAVVVGGTNIFGGSGTILGTALGVLLLGVISTSLTPLHIEPAWEKAFQGALILTAVLIDALRSRE